GFRAVLVRRELHARTGSTCPSDCARLAGRGAAARHGSSDSPARAFREKPAFRRPRALAPSASSGGAEPFRDNVDVVARGGGHVGRRARDLDIWDQGLVGLLRISLAGRRDNRGWTVREQAATAR